MKHLIALKCLFFIFNLYCMGQWTKVLYYFPTGEGDFNDIEITNNNKIFIAKDKIVYVSNDLAVSWDTSYYSDDDGDYFAIDFLNNDTGYIARAGDGGLAIRTLDGGVIWEEIYPSNGYFGYNNDVFVLSANDIYFAMAYFGLGVVQISHDACETSEIITPSITDAGIAAIVCTSVDTCLCVSGDPFGFFDADCFHYIYKSYNGGTDWDVITLVSDVKDIFCTSKNICYARGGDEVVKSTDQGETWETVFELDTIFYFSALTFINDSVGYVAAYHFDSPAVVYRTNDGGVNWIITEFDSAPNRITGIDCIDAENCFLTGSGYVYKTSNGGISSINNNNPTINFNLYPNPSSSFINISSQNNTQITQITTTNYLGQKISLVFNSELKADISHFPPGIYFTEIITDQGKGVQKWVKM